MFPGMVASALPNGKKGWKEGYDLFNRMTGKEAILEEPYLVLEPVTVSIDPISEWWFQTLDKLQKLIIQNCEINVLDETVLLKASKLWYCGLLFILENHPSYAHSIRYMFSRKISHILEGESFWEYNPLRVVRQILWLSHVDISVRDKNFSCPPFRNVEEQHVSDQEEAIEYVNLSRGNVFATLIDIMMDS